MFYVVSRPLLLPSPSPLSTPLSTSPLPCVIEIPHSRAAGLVVPLIAWLPITFPMEIPHSRAAGFVAPLLAWLPYSHGFPTRIAPH